MDYGFCPRCGVRRPDGLRWCRKCGFDFENPPKPDPQPSVPRPGPDTPLQRIDLRPVGDRRAIAEWTRDAFTVRCLGTVGGLIGMFLGFLVFAAIGGALNAGLLSVFLAFIGIPVGFVLGVRLSLGLLAK
jgi:hypothetical protein